MNLKDVMSSLGFRTKLTLLMLVPLFGMIYFSIQLVHERWDGVEQAGKLGLLSAVAVKAGALVHELQKERGMSAGYIGSGGTKFVEQLPQQRIQADVRLQALLPVLKGLDIEQFAEDIRARLRSDVEGALVELDKLAEMRRGVTGLQVLVAEPVRYYSNLNQLLLRIAGYTQHVSSSAEVVDMSSAYYYFLQSKERAGIERAVLSATFAADAFAEGMFERFISLLTAQNTFDELFKSFASDGQMAFYEGRMGHASIQEVERMRTLARNNATYGGFGVDAETWFTTITTKINLLKEVEDHLTEELQALATRMEEDARTEMTLLVGLTLFFFMLTVLMGLMIASGLTRNVTLLHGTIEQIEQNADLTLQVPLAGNDEIGRIAQAFNRMMGKFHEALMNVSVAADHLGASATEMKQSTVQACAGVDEQRRETEQVAAAINEMAASVAEVANNTAGAAEAAQKMSDETRAGRRVVNDTIAAIGGLASEVEKAAGVIHALDEHSDNIGTVLEVIRGIAEQTNLLALNAAIEAARAGEQGRGFAVVADEVRTLAQRTQQSTQEIQSMIERLQVGTRDAVKVMEQGRSQAQQSVEQASKAGESLSSIAEAVDRINDLNTQVASAAEQQSAVAEEINQNIHRIDSVSEQTVTTVQQNSKASEEFFLTAQSLQQMVGRFKT